MKNCSCDTQIFYFFFQRQPNIRNQCSVLEVRGLCRKLKDQLQVSNNSLCRRRVLTADELIEFLRHWAAMCTLFPHTNNGRAASFKYMNNPIRSIFNAQILIAGSYNADKI